MRLGAYLAHLFPSSSGRAGPEPTAEWARRLVDEGFESLWTPQIIGREFFVPDPFVTLAVAAAVTEGVELGTATLQLPLHHPAELAHRIRSLREVAGDRLSIGVSPGSTDLDHTLLGRDFTDRFRRFDENLAQLRDLTEGPFLLGSWGAKVERAAREFDGWIASAHRRTPQQILAALRRYRAAGGRRAIVCAVPAGDRDALDRYAEAGFDDAIVVFPPRT